MQLLAFEKLTPEQIGQCARILREAFLPIDAYQDSGEAEAEVATFLKNPDRFAIAAIEAGVVLGFVGGIDSYSHAIELHPLAVDPPH